MNIRTILITAIMLASATGADAQAPDGLTRACNEIKRYDAFQNGQVAFLAVDMKTGDVIAECNPDMSLMPASNTKIFSTAAALELYGPDFTYNTDLLYTGKIDSTGVLVGNLIIKGSGDPSLGSRFFTDQPNYNYTDAFVKAVKAAGIHHITGNIIGDGTIYEKEMTPPTWSWEDIGNYFGAVPNGLTVCDNMVTLHFKTGREGSEAVYMGCTPDIKNLNVLSMGVSTNVAQENSNTFGKSYQLHKYVQGPMPMNRKDVEVRSIMPDPPLFIASQLKDSLMANGVTVFGLPFSAADYSRYQALKNEPADTLCSLKSPRLAEIIKKTNLFSVNLFAEHCLSLVGISQAKTSDVEKAAWAMMAFWQSKGVGIRGMSLNDGCGLSRYNICTPRQLCQVLTYMRMKSQYYEAFNQSLTMCGGLGTMGNMCLYTRAQNNARGKSGTIRRVKSYSGYVKSRSGRELAFSIIINNFTSTSNDTRRMMEKFIVGLADYNN